MRPRPGGCWPSFCFSLCFPASALNILAGAWSKTTPPATLSARNAAAFLATGLSHSSSFLPLRPPVDVELFPWHGRVVDVGTEWRTFSNSNDKGAREDPNRVGPAIVRCGMGEKALLVLISGKITAEPAAQRATSRLDARAGARARLVSCCHEHRQPRVGKDDAVVSCLPCEKT